MSDAKAKKVIRVEFVLTDLGVGGAERVFQTLATSLPPAEFEVGVTTLYGGGPVADELEGVGIPVTCLRARGPSDVGGFLRFRRHMAVLAADVVFINSTPVTQLWAVLAVHRKRTRIVSGLHYTQRLRRSRRTAWVNRWTQGAVARFVALSEMHKSYIAKHEGIDPARIAVIPNGVDVARYGEAREFRDSARALFGYAPDDVVVGILARLRPEKRHEYFLRVAESVSRTRTGLRFLILGDGPEETRLRDLVLELGIAHRVGVVFAGYQADVPRVIGAVDIGVLCSDREAFPLSLLEFMAAGIPVVSSDVGSVRDIVEDGQTGVVVSAVGVEPFVAAVGALADDAVLRTRMGSAGATRAIAEFSQAAMVRRIADLIREVARQ